ncbi:hypothetical protein AAFF_G00128800 [Aldrovandia affinis]|uniref:Uncharacterized protein n=1 Tax=Aldrovandia affinis TaxID=143900 RepID=A0AAD7WY60_9TELE|nr:hypothetical protein AAFF_G00128800 [Aldrovandia affinis]
MLTEIKGFMDTRSKGTVLDSGGKPRVQDDAWQLLLSHTARKWQILQLIAHPGFIFSALRRPGMFRHRPGQD